MGPIAQSVQRLNTSWTVRDLNPVGTKFSALGPTQPPVQWVPGLCRG